jgi:glucose-6-phosphate 1-epimerase
MPIQNNETGDFVTVSADDGSSIKVYRQGAHVASWKNSSGREFVYLSPSAVFKKGGALRGGVPIIWPQFSDMGSGTVHGVARVRDWNLLDERSGFVSFGLSVRPGDAQLGNTYADLVVEFQFSNTSLNMTLHVANGGDSPLPFKFAFHTYFAVSHIHNVQVNGLDNSSYADNLFQRKVFPAAAIRNITQEVDRVYYDVEGPVTISDSGHGTSYVIASANLADVVLWNPWIERAKKFVDLPDDGYNFFVCVEHGVIGKDVVVPSKGSWSGSQIVQVNANSSKI